jgi:hypothetical protein
VANLTFIWDEELQKWVGIGATEARFAKDNTLPPEIINIEGAKRFTKKGEKYLIIPLSKEKDLVKLNPNFAKGPNPIEQQLGTVVKPIAAGIEAYEKRRKESKTIQEFFGIPEEGIAKTVTKNVKEVVNKFGAQEEDINAPLPGQKPKEVFQVPTGTPSGIKPITTDATGTQSVSTATPSSSGSYYAGSTFITEQPIAGVQYDAISIEDETNLGLFTINKKSNQLLLPQTTGGKSEVVDGDRFANVTLYNLPPEKVKQYQSKYGLSQTGKMNAALAGKIFSDAKKASYENYVRSNPEVTTDKTQVSWEEAIINPASVGGTSDGGGVSAKQIKSSKDAIRISANQLGVTLDEAKVNSLANAYARGDINATVLPYEIVRQGEIDFTKGAAGNTYGKLRELASAYGIQYSEDWYKNSVASILSGKEAEDTYDVSIKELAKSKYPTLSKQIDAGRNVRDLASPYVESMAQLLEIGSDTITLDDFYINQALTGIDADGTPKQKPLWEFQQQLRQDPRWRSTRNAQESMMSASRKVLQDFGLVS